MTITCNVHNYAIRQFVHVYIHMYIYDKKCDRLPPPPPPSPQWKIRRVLAYSLHELAKVLGSETASDDLLPVFEEFCTKDIDDVKIGALSHLAEFFEVGKGHFERKL